MIALVQFEQNRPKRTTNAAASFFCTLSQNIRRFGMKEKEVVGLNFGFSFVGSLFPLEHFVFEQKQEHLPAALLVNLVFSYVFRFS